MLRISALFNTYGDRTEMYIQETNQKTTALFGGYQSAFSLCVMDDADFSELNSFFEFLGAEVFCELDVAQKLTSAQMTVCNIMRLSCDLEGRINHSKISEVYGVLEKGSDGDIELPPFDLWYTDFCLRFNHTAAEYALLENAVAVCGFMTDKASLITGVAVDSQSRGKGLGKKIVADLVTAVREKYKNSEIYAAATDEKRAFYEKCGFEFDSRCAILKYGSV